MSGCVSPEMCSEHALGLSLPGGQDLALLEGQHVRMHSYRYAWLLVPLLTVSTILCQFCLWKNAIQQVHEK